MEKIIIHGEEFIYDGRGYVPAPPAPFQETDPKFEAEKSIFAKKTDIPEIPDLTPYAKKDDIPVVDNFGLKAQYADIYYRKDAVYENDYIRLKSIGTNKIYEVKKLTVRTSFGDKVVDSKVVFNNGFCYLFSEYLSKSANWELFILEYDIVNNIRTYPPDLRGKIGRNILINEPQDGYHGAMMTGVFNSLYSQLGGSTRQVVHTPSTIFTENLDEKAVELKFNAATYAYWYGANTMEVSSAPDILVVSSHTGNTDERKDITPDANTFKNNVIAVSAGEKTDGSGVWTSYGFGVEFFEAYDKAEMNLRYPAKNHYTAIFGMYTSDARTIITGTETNPTTGVVKRHTVGAQIVVGETLYLHHGSNIIEFKVAELIDEHTLKSDRDLPVIPSADGSTKAYVWNYIAIGDIFRSAPQQSATCAMVLAKFALIQDRTNANWQLVREAARMTASNSTMQVVSGKKVYTTNWDMKRGFGIIDVEKAIEYIEDNYINNQEYIDSVIPQLPKINPLLKLEDLDDNNPITKKMLMKALESIQGA